MKNQKKLERVMGIEPTCGAWKAPVLPLNYTRDRRQFSLRACVVNWAMGMVGAR